MVAQRVLKLPLRVQGGAHAIEHAGDGSSIILRCLDDRQGATIVRPGVLYSALLQQHKELEEAARVTGATTVRAVATVTLPLLLPALLNGWLWAFSATLRDFTFAIFLMTGRNMVLPSAMWVSWNIPDIAGTAALGSVYIFGFFFVTMATRYLDERQRRKAGWESVG